MCGFWSFTLNSLTHTVNGAPEKECVFRLQRRFSVESEELFRAGTKVEIIGFHKHIHEQLLSVFVQKHLSLRFPTPTSQFLFFPKPSWAALAKCQLWRTAGLHKYAIAQQMAIITFNNKKKEKLTNIGQIFLLLLWNILIQAFALMSECNSWCGSTQGWLSYKLRSS